MIYFDNLFFDGGIVMYKTLFELDCMELNELYELEKKVMKDYKETKEAYYHFGIANIDGLEELELYINRIRHILYGEVLDNENR